MRLNLLIAMAGLVACSSSLKAQDLNSVDFTPLEGTSWGQSSVRLDFGAGMGMGTMTFTGINGGVFDFRGICPYNLPPYSVYDGPTTLSNGATFAPETEIFFVNQPGSDPGLTGFNLTVELDSGSFTPGSLFSFRSLGADPSNSRSQYYQPVFGLATPLLDQLPTDGAANLPWALMDAGLNLYGPDGFGGASKGLAAEITGGSFSLNVLSSPGYDPGGLAMTIVTPVPEPSSLLLVSIGGLFYLRRRRLIGIMTRA